jgi:hypothetical protein
VGALTSGQDLLGKHAYEAEAYYSIGGHDFEGSATYANHDLYPTLALAAERALFGLPAGLEGLERQSALDAAIDVPFDRIDRSVDLAADYELRWYTPLTRPALHPDQPSPTLPDEGRAASVGLTASYSSVHAFANSISPEEGLRLSVTGRAGRPWLGGDFAYDFLRGSAATYLRMPWALHQVLALRVAGGWGEGDLGNRRIFSLGGPVLSDPVLALVNGTVPGTFLRGYPPGFFTGNEYALGSAEYRFPVVNLDRGFWTLPLYLRRLHGAAFVDVGQAANELDWRQFAPGVGAEARLEFTIAYALTTTLRLGYARGLAAGGINDVYLLLGGGF